MDPFGGALAQLKTQGYVTFSCAIRKTALSALSAASQLLGCVCKMQCSLKWRSSHASMQTDFHASMKSVHKDAWLNWLAHRPAFLDAPHWIPLHPSLETIACQEAYRCVHGKRGDGVSRKGTKVEFLRMARSEPQPKLWFFCIFF